MSNTMFKFGNLKFFELHIEDNIDNNQISQQLTVILIEWYTWSSFGLLKKKFPKMRIFLEGKLVRYHLTTASEIFSNSKMIIKYPRLLTPNLIDSNVITFTFVRLKVKLPNLKEGCGFVFWFLRKEYIIFKPFLKHSWEHSWSIFQFIFKLYL